MADERELFPILEKTDASGEAPSEASIGLASAGLVYVPTLGAVDNSGDLLLIPVKTEGQASGNAVTVLSCEDPSGNMQYLKCANDGSLNVTFEGVGTCVSASGSITASGLGADNDVASIALTASKLHKAAMFSGAAFHPTLWTLIWVDDDGGMGEVDNELARFVTGPGDFAHEMTLDCVEFTSGGTGTQTLKVVGNQVVGKLTDLHAVVSALEKA